MSDLRDPKGFEDRWRQLDPTRRYAAPSLDGRSIRAQLHRMVAAAPQAAVTHYGRPTSLRSLRRHLLYLSRDGEIALTGREGQKLRGREDVLQRADDWVMDQIRYRGGVALAYTMVLSMPAGTPAEPVERAARAFAVEAYPASDFLTVLHQDRPHPHVHLAVRGEDDEGRSRSLSYADFYRFSELFAEKLRDLGVDADATPRWRRGVVLRPEDRRLRRARLAYEQGKAAPPRHLVDAHQEALKIARGHEPAAGGSHDHVLDRHRRIREGYLELADRLQAMDQPGDKELADKLRRFVADMPPLVTRRQMLVEQARAFDLRKDRSQALEQQRDPPARSR